jgi:hypothetical protein
MNGIGPQNAYRPVEKSWKSKDWSRAGFSLYDSGEANVGLPSEGRWLPAAKLSPTKPSLIWDFGTYGIGVGR